MKKKYKKEIKIPILPIIIFKLPITLYTDGKNIFADLTKT